MPIFNFLAEFQKRSSHLAPPGARMESTSCSPLLNFKNGHPIWPLQEDGWKTPHVCPFPNLKKGHSTWPSRRTDGKRLSDDEWAISIAVVRCLVPSLAIGTYGKGQVDVESSYGGFGITLDDIAHLVQPPRCIFERCWLEDKALSLLIAVVDACHMVLMCQLILPLCRFEGECWNK
jgi:hypothetical protein